MNETLTQQIETYILTNFQEYSKEQLVSELIKSGFSQSDANEIYDTTVKKLSRPSQKMEYTNSSIMPFILVGTLFLLLILSLFLI